MNITDSEVDAFIAEVATTAEPGRLLEAWGVCDPHCESVPMYVEMCKNWGKHPTAVYTVAGVYFYRLMKQAAMSRMAYEEAEAEAEEVE
jgi:hypothetical protein